MLAVLFPVLICLVPLGWVWYLYFGMTPTFDLAVYEMQEWDREFEVVTGKAMKYHLDPTLELREHRVQLRLEADRHLASIPKGFHGTSHPLSQPLKTALHREWELKKHLVENKIVTVEELSEWWQTEEGIECRSV